MSDQTKNEVPIEATGFRAHDAPAELQVIPPEERRLPENAAVRSRVQRLDDGCDRFEAVLESIEEAFARLLAVNPNGTGSR